MIFARTDTLLSATQKIYCADTMQMLRFADKVNSDCVGLMFLFRVFVNAFWGYLMHDFCTDLHGILYIYIYIYIYTYIYICVCVFIINT